jgi:hypothetical protein
LQFLTTDDVHLNVIDAEDPEVIFCWCEMKFVSELGSFSVKIEN